MAEEKSRSIYFIPYVTPKCTKCYKTTVNCKFCHPLVVKAILATGLELKDGSLNKDGSFIFHCSECKKERNTTVDSIRSGNRSTKICYPCFRRYANHIERTKKTEKRMKNARIIISHSKIRIEYTDDTISLQVSPEARSILQKRPERSRCDIKNLIDLEYRHQIIYFKSREEMDEIERKFLLERPKEPIILKDLSVEDATNIIGKFSAGINPFKLYMPVIEYKEQDVPIPPYILGVWLGDGTSAGTTLTNIDPEIIDEWLNYGKSLGLNVRRCGQETKNGQISYAFSAEEMSLGLKNSPEKTDEVMRKVIDGGITRIAAAGQLGVTPSGIRHYKKVIDEHGSMVERYNKTNTFLSNLRKLNLVKNKHIPEVYIKNSIKCRSELLAGLMDTDGSMHTASYEIVQKNKRIADGISTIAKSLGWFVYQREVQKTCTNSPTKATGTYHRLTLMHSSMDTIDLPCKLLRKQLKVEDRTLLQPPSVILDDSKSEKLPEELPEESSEESSEKPDEEDNISSPNESTPLPSPSPVIPKRQLILKRKDGK